MTGIPFSLSDEKFLPKICISMYWLLGPREVVVGNVHHKGTK